MIAVKTVKTLVDALWPYVRMALSLGPVVIAILMLLSVMTSGGYWYAVITSPVFYPQDAFRALMHGMIAIFLLLNMMWWYFDSRMDRAEAHIESTIKDLLRERDDYDYYCDEYEDDFEERMRANEPPVVDEDEEAKA